MSPGTTVTTVMPWRAASAPSASDQPRSANLAASYGREVRDADAPRRSR